jgi:hypothetical protein
VRFGTIEFQSFSLLLASSNTVPEESEKEPGDVHHVEGNIGDDPVMTTR